MIHQAEFEEKEFECEFNIQLSKKYNGWSPGQSAESILGFDRADFINHPYILDLYFKRRWFVLRNKPEGIFLDREVVREYSRYIDHALPPFRLNFFVQYKRPEYFDKESVKSRREWTVWKCPYYRYKIEEKQQKILENLETYAQNRALILYACPAFFKKEELYEHIVNSSVIESTNYVKPTKLKDHKKYTFLKAGSHGWAFSEPEEIEGEDFKTLLYQFEELPQVHASDLIIKAGKLIENVLNELEYKENHLIFRIIKDMNAHIEEYHYEQDKYSEMAKAIAHITALNFVYGISLKLMG